MDIIKVICNAISQVPKEYYKIKTSEGESIIRERVFCYEFYHQIRKIQDDANEISIGSIYGEVDKSGRLDYNGENPDFIFHSPGDNDHNLSILEVKVKYDNLQIKSDLTKLNNFIKNHQYKYGIFLLLNYSLDEFKLKINEHINDFNQYKDNNDIIILCKKSYFTEIEIIRIGDLLNN